MKILRGLDRPLRALLVAVVATLCLGPAVAHDISVGDIEITHPFATPSLAGTSTGAAYFVAIENHGSNADKLLHAATPVAASVELHSMSVDAQGVMRMREVGVFALAPKAVIRMRPGMGLHFMLVGLKRSLKEGDTFPMTLQFEHAGKVEVKVVVQTPRASSGAADMHMH